MARVEEAGLATLGQRLARLQREHGGAVVAGVGQQLLGAEDVLGRGGGADLLLGLLVVLERPPVVVGGLVAEVAGEGVDVELGELLAQVGHVVVGQLRATRQRSTASSSRLAAPARALRNGFHAMARP